ncbi:MAG: glycosyltransferase [Clostridia bacterium]|nr:glycosyltransferase [Clostridia bacterium]
MEQARTQPKISVIVPVYNTEAYLPACVETLLRQTHTNLELIFVDDGSTDGSGALLDAYAKKDPRVRVIHKSNGGVSAARNIGIDSATGEYIGFVDSDDTVEPMYAETLLRAFSAHPEIGVSICNRYIHGHPNGRETGGTAGTGKVLSPREAAYFAVSIGKSFEGYLWNKLFRAEIFRAEPRFRLDPSVAICEDLLLCVSIFAAGQKAYYDPTPLYHYNYRETGALRTLDERRMSEFSARDRIEAIAAAFGGDVLHAAELSHVKAALNLFAAAKQAKNKPLASAMQRRVDERIKPLLSASDVPISEKCNLLIRRAFPVLSLRIFNRFA